MVEAIKGTSPKDMLARNDLKSIRIGYDTSVTYEEKDDEFINDFKDEIEGFDTLESFDCLIIVKKLLDARGNELPDNDPPLIKMEFKNNNFKIDVKHLTHVL